MYDAIQCKVFSVLMGKSDNILYELFFVHPRISLYIIRRRLRIDCETTIRRIVRCD